MAFDRTQRMYDVMLESTFPRLLLVRCYDNARSVVVTVVPSNPTLPQY